MALMYEVGSLKNRYIIYNNIVMALDSHQNFIYFFLLLDIKMITSVPILIIMKSYAMHAQLSTELF